MAKVDNSAKAVKSDAAAKSSKPATPPNDESDDDARPRPKWVNAEPKRQGDVWLMTRHTEPYSTELECDREVPKALQGAIAEYTDLLLGNGQAKNMRLAEIDVGELERDHWIEKRTIDVGGEEKNMYTLHLLFGFDKGIEDKIINLADNAVVTQRLQGAGVVLGGVLGLLALVWGGLSMAGNRQGVNVVPEAAAPVAFKARVRSTSSVVSIVLLSAVIVAIVMLALFFARH